MVELCQMKSILEDILNKVHKGDVTPQEALKCLKDYPYQDLNFAKVDHHRELRRGFPEIIYGLGKTEDQILKISQAILDKKNNLLITKIDPKIFNNIKKKLPQLSYNSPAKAAYFKQNKPPSGKGTVAVITAGTSDIPVAEEAKVIAESMGC